MDETPCFLDMYFDITIDFVGNRHVEIETMGKEKYRISVILAITGDGYKLPTFVIVKGEEGKTIEKQLQDLYYVKNKEMYVYCQPQGWCTSELFCLWIKEIFIPYENFIAEKCLLVLDKASAHISIDSLSFLEKNKIAYVLIPPGMTPECQPLDVSVNKLFKDNIKYKFELNRIDLDNTNGKIKLKTARLNMIEIIYNSWKDDKIITKDIIMKGFKYCGITNNFYLSNDEYKLYDNYMFDLIDAEKFDILDDLGQELNVTKNDFKEKNDSDEEDVEQVEKEKMDISNSINPLSSHDIVHTSR